MWPFKQKEKEIEKTDSDTVSCVAEKPVEKPCDDTPVSCVVKTILNDIKTSPLSEWGISYSPDYQIFSHTKIKYKLCADINTVYSKSVFILGISINTFNTNEQLLIWNALSILHCEIYTKKAKEQKEKDLQTLKDLFPQCF